MTYGLTSAGFTRKRLPIIKTELETAMQSAFGLIDITAGSVFSQLIGIFAEREALLWERCEELYYAMYPASAEGAALDGVAQMVGIVRLASVKTTVIGALLGVEGTVVLSGTQVTLAGGTAGFELIADTEITNEHAIQVTLAPDDATNGDTYEFDVNEVTYSVEYIDATPTLTELVAEIVSDLGTISGITITNNGESITLTATDYETAFSVNPVSHIDISSLETPANFQALLVGATIVPVGTLTEIATPVSGLTSCTNYVVGVTGRAVESDANLRIRRASSLSVIGSSTVEAIRSRILQGVDDVTAVSVCENTTDAVVDSRPAHSFEAVVSGGADQDIADMIWAVKPAGIATYGTESAVEVTDSEGNIHDIYFSRPTPVEIYVEIEYTLNAEEDYPVGGDNNMKAGILALGNLSDIGDDVIIQKFFTPVYAISGIATAVIRIRVGETPGGSGYISNLTIASTEIATFETAHITITAV